MISIDLANNVLTLTDADSGLTQAFGGGTIDDVTWVVTRERNALTIPLTPAAQASSTPGVTPPVYVAPTPTYIMVVVFKETKAFPLRIPLARVDPVSQPTWLDTLTGAQNARADIIAISTT